MYKFRNVLIEVKDLEISLNPLLGYFIEILKIEKVFFYYFEKKSIPIWIDGQMETESRNDIYHNKVNDFIINNVSEHVNTELLKLSDNVVKSILRASMLNDIDLIFLEYGRNTASREEIIKIAKNSYCTILTLPEKRVWEKIKKILIPVDFSDYSRNAINLALEIANASNIKIILNHVYFVPSGYHATGKSYEESASIEKQAAKKQCVKFLKDYDQHVPGFSFSYVLDDDKDPTDKIFKDAADNEIDLLIMGAKGKRNSPDTLTGSISFSLLIYNQEIPLMIIKNKMENYDLAEENLKNL